MAVTIKKVAYGGWENCVSVSNGIIEAIALTDVGPRIIWFGFVGKSNMFKEFSEMTGKTGGDTFNIYGGHRLWHSPENRNRTYQPDNKPVKWEEVENGIRLIQDVEEKTQIQKEMEITMHPTEASVRVLHRLTNRGLWDIELAVWPVSIMAPGGLEVVPQNTRDTGLLNNRTLALWPYTRMTDSRLYWGDKYFAMREVSDIDTAAKVGMSNEAGWAAYFNQNHLFVKHFAPKPGAVYPDDGCTYETYTKGGMLEMETLSPLTALKPGAHVDHLERWDLFDEIEIPEVNEETLDAVLKGRVKK